MLNSRLSNLYTEREMGFFSQKVERSDLEAGDHIYSWRTLFIYAHHGIYVGEDRVVHFSAGKAGPNSSFSASKAGPSCSFSASSTFPACGFRKSGSSGVTISCLNCFLDGDLLYRYEYGVSKWVYEFKMRGGTCTTAKSDAPKTVIYKAIYLLNSGYGEYNLIKRNCESFALYCKTGLIVSLVASGQVSSTLGIVIPTNPFGKDMWSSDIGARLDAIKVEVERLHYYTK